VADRALAIDILKEVKCEKLLSSTRRRAAELLGIEIFTTLLEAKIMNEDYRQDYNQKPPHSSLGQVTPYEFTGNWHHNNQGLTTVPAH